MGPHDMTLAVGRGSNYPIVEEHPVLIVVASVLMLVVLWLILRPRGR